MSELTKNELKIVIEMFMDRWDNSTKLGWKDLLPNKKTTYRGFTLKISFGQGVRISGDGRPWIAFLKYNQTVSQGVYPIIGYKYKDQKIDVLIGTSFQNEPKIIKDTISLIEDNDMYFETSKDGIVSIINQLDNIMNYFDTLNFNNKINISGLKDKKENINIKNIILYGPPGVGKTHNYQNLISMIEEGNSQKEIFDTISNNEEVELNNEVFQKIKDEKRAEFITFHQSYSYEDFIEGYKPNKDGIELQDGIFKTLCDDAKENEEQNYYIVIDEINRGNISKIFGELITLIEEDKRDTYEVTLPYSKTAFKVPSNLYIIATMNSTDKSIATIDIALRRRFTFLKMKPNLDLVNYDDAKQMMKRLNIYIEDKLGADYQLGHSYFMKVQNDDDLEFVKEYKIKPLLEEYFYAEGKSVDEIISEALSEG